MSRVLDTATNTLRLQDDFSQTVSAIYELRHEKTDFLVSTRLDTSQSVQPQKKTRKVKFQI